MMRFKLKLGTVHEMKILSLLEGIIESETKGYDLGECYLT